MCADTCILEVNLLGLFTDGFYAQQITTTRLDKFNLTLH